MKDMSTLVLTIIGLLGGLGLFLYGMNIMADGLQKSAGSKMKKLLSILTVSYTHLDVYKRQHLSQTHPIPLRARPSCECLPP